MPYTADEMPTVEVIPPQGAKGKPEVRQPERKQSAPSQDGKPITESQKKLLFAKLKGSNISEDAFKAFYNIEHLSDLPFSEMNKALEAIKNGEIAEVVESGVENIPELCAECATPIINGACRNMNCPEGKPEDE